MRKQQTNVALHGFVFLNSAIAILVPLPHSLLQSMYMLLNVTIAPSLVIVTSVVKVTIVILVITAPTVAVVADSYWILPLCFVP